MKKQWMKHIAYTLFIIGIAVPALAQQPKVPQRDRREMRELPSPENNARRIMREFKKTFQLTEKEYEKVYELYLKYEKSLMPEQATGNRGGMPPRGGFGGFGGGPDFGGGPGMGGGMGRPPQGDFQPGKDMPQDLKAMMEEKRKEQEKKQQKAGKTLTKKMKKVLKGEQFGEWEKWENERKSKKPEKRQ